MMAAVLRPIPVYLRELAYGCCRPIIPFHEVLGPVDEIVRFIAAVGYAWQEGNHIPAPAAGHAGGRRELSRQRPHDLVNRGVSTVGGEDDCHPQHPRIPDLVERIERVPLLQAGLRPFRQLAKWPAAGRCSRIGVIIAHGTIAIRFERSF